MGRVNLAADVRRRKSRKPRPPLRHRRLILIFSSFQNRIGSKILILVPGEAPLNLIHVRNFELLILAGATILPANPSFYTRPQTIEQVVDTVVGRVLDHLGLGHNLVARWGEERE